MTANAENPWGGECRIAIGRALVHYRDGPMTAGEIATATGRDRSNVKRSADELAKLGVLERREPPAPEKIGPGPKPKTSYAFAPHPRGRPGWEQK